MFKERATGEDWEVIKEYFPSVQMQPDCETVVGAVWDEIKAMCPKGKKSKLTVPDPDKIEKLVCEFASSEIIEKRATQAACALIKDEFPSVEICEMLLEHYWDEILEKCPKAQPIVVV
jgi:hypothetical protein